MTNNIYRGRFCGHIIQEHFAGYRGYFCFESGGEIDIFGADWKQFRENMVKATGVVLPMRKYFCFAPISDYEMIAGIDAANQRTTCIVNGSEYKSGWRAWEALLSAIEKTA